MAKFFGLLVLVIFSLFLSSCQTNEKEKDRAELFAKLGISYYQNGNYPQALTQLQRAKELDPMNPQIHNNLGLVYFMREKLDLAETSIRRAVELDETYTDAKNNLVRVLIEKKLYPEAQKILDQVLADLTYGGLERAYINQGLIYFNQNEFAKSEKPFLKAIEAQRDACLAHNFYGRAIFEQQDYERAKPALDRAISFCQKVQVDEPHYFSALAHYRAGDPDKSRARFEEIVRIYPNGKYLEKSRQMLALLRKGPE